MRLRVRFGVLLAVCAIAPLAANVAPASAAMEKECKESITGAGSSLQKIAQREVWIEGKADAFGKTGELWKKSICKTLPGVEYYSSSSGKGMAQWGNNATETLKEEELENKSGGKEKIFPTYVGTDAAPEKKGIEAEGELAKMDKAGGQGLKAGEGIVAVPVAQSAVAVLVSLPAGCTLKVEAGKHPRISAKHLYEEWTHKTNGVKGVTWEALIENGTIEAKAGETCGAVGTKPTTTFARASASGTTAGFKRFFKALKSKVPADEKEWEEKTKTVEKALSAAEWPAGTGQEEEGLVEGVKVKLEKGSQLAKAGYENANSLSYADLADMLAVNKELAATKVVNHEANTKKYASFLVEVTNAEFEKTTSTASPEEESGESNCGGVTYEPLPTAVEGNADWSKVIEISQEKSGATNYPICTLTYDLAWHKYKEVNAKAPKAYGAEQVNAVFALLHYVVAEKEGQVELPAKHYGKLPAAVRKLAEKGLEKLPGEAGATINF
jgi:hypothetical protein